MSGASAADLLVGGVRGEPARVADGSRVNAGACQKMPLGAPEAAHPEDRRLDAVRERALQRRAQHLVPRRHRHFAVRPAGADAGSSAPACLRLNSISPRLARPEHECGVSGCSIAGHERVLDACSTRSTTGWRGSRSTVQSAATAITLALVRELAACVERADLDPAVHVLLLAGNGAGFCGGYDLVESAEGIGATTRTAARSHPRPPSAGGRSASRRRRRIRRSIRRS